MFVGKKSERRFASAGKCVAMTALDLLYKPELVASAVEARKRHFLRHLYIKCIILPRQARDKHRENSKKVPFSLRGNGGLGAAA